MNIQEEGVIQIVVREEEPYHNDVVRGGGGRGNDSTKNTTRKGVSVATLREEFRLFMGNLQNIINVELPANLPFELQEIQFSAEITGGGQFNLLGIGVSSEVTSAITFVLQRKKDKTE